MKKGISSLALFLVMVLMTRPLQAEVYNIQFAGYDGPGGPHGSSPMWTGGGTVDPSLYAGSGQGTWNLKYAIATNSTNLVTGTGAATTVHFTYDNNFQGRKRYERVENELLTTWTAIGKTQFNLIGAVARDTVVG